MPTITVSRLYSILLERVLPLVSTWCDSRVTNLILLMMGLYRGRSVHLTRIASRIPSSARKLSTVERIRCFLSNPAIDVHEVRPGRAGTAEAGRAERENPAGDRCE